MRITKRKGENKVLQRPGIEHLIEQMVWSVNIMKSEWETEKQQQKQRESMAHQTGISNCLLYIPRDDTDFEASLTGK